MTELWDLLPLTPGWKLAKRLCGVAEVDRVELELLGQDGYWQTLLEEAVARDTANREFS